MLDKSFRQWSYRRSINSDGSLGNMIVDDPPIAVTRVDYQSIEDLPQIIAELIQGLEDHYRIMTGCSEVKRSV